MILGLLNIDIFITNYCIVRRKTHIAGNYFVLVKLGLAMPLINSTVTNQTASSELDRSDMHFSVCFFQTFKVDCMSSRLSFD